MTAGRIVSRWISLWATTLVLLQVGGTLHLAAAPHGVCWEHGAVVDLDGASARVEGVVPAVAPGVNRPSAPVIRSDGHSHCPALWVMRAARSEGPADAADLL